MYHIVGMTSERVFYDLSAETASGIYNTAVAFLAEYPKGLVGWLKNDNQPIQGTWFKHDLSKLRRLLCIS